MRRQLCALICLTAGGLLFLPAQGVAGETWVGKKIIMKEPGARFGPLKDGKIDYQGELLDMTYMVLKEQGGFVQVRQRGEEGWVAKTDAVLLEKAVAFFTEKIRMNPKDADLYAARAEGWVHQGNLDNAIKDLTEAIRLEPDQPDWYINRGTMYHDKKDYDRAIADYNQAIRLDPNDPLPYLTRAESYEAKKDYAQALADFARTIQLDPNELDAYNGQAWILATCPDAKFRDGKKAVEIAKKACELAKWKEPRYLDTLAAANAEIGEFERAITYQMRALEDRDFEREQGVEARKRLELYKNKMPYRSP